MRIKKEGCAKRRKTFCLIESILFTLPLLVVLFCYKLPVLAIESYEKLGLLVGEDAEGNPVSMATAVALDLDNDIMVLSGFQAVSDSAVTYSFLTCGSEIYTVELSGYDEYIGVVSWSMSEYVQSEYFCELAYAYEGESVKGCYLDSNYDMWESDGTLTGLVTGDVVEYQYEGFSIDEKLDIMVLIDSNNKCVGIIGETNVAWSLVTNEDTFYSQSGGTSTETPTETQTEEPTEEPTEESTEKPTETSTEVPAETTERKDTEDSGGGVNPIAVIAVIGGVSGAAAVAVLVVNKKKESGQNVGDAVFYDQPTMNFNQPGFVQPAQISIQVTAVGGCLGGRVYLVGESGLWFGRDDSATVQFPPDTQGVSRRHCRLYWQNGMLKLEDIGSSYGTFLSGSGKLVPNQPVAVRTGDVFYLGEQSNSFRID